MPWVVSSIVNTLHKKGPKQQVTNYRPISLTSIICKSMEKFVKDSLMNHIWNQTSYSPMINMGLGKGDHV
jgi:hypothetical protein